MEFIAAWIEDSIKPSVAIGFNRYHLKMNVNVCATTDINVCISQVLILVNISTTTTA